MIRQLALIVFLGATGPLCAQRLDPGVIPQPVKSALKRTYSGNDIIWNKEASGYEASFKMEGKEVSLVIDAAGKTLETETEISRSALPSAVLEAVKKEYSGYKIEEAARIVDMAGVVTFEAEVEKGEHTFDLIFDSNGKLLSKESKQDENK